MAKPAAEKPAEPMETDTPAADKGDKTAVKSVDAITVESEPFQPIHLCCRHSRSMPCD